MRCMIDIRDLAEHRDFGRSNRVVRVDCHSISAFVSSGPRPALLFTTPHDFCLYTMFSGSTFGNSQGQYQPQDQSRPPFAHSQSSFTHGQPFNVASMSNQGPAHSPSLRASALGSSTSLNMNDSLAQSRGPYQAGYLMVRIPLFEQTRHHILTRTRTTRSL